MHRPSQRQQGFIVTLEVVLLVTILVLGSLVGVIAVRNALFELATAKAQYEIIVKDADDPPLRVKPVSFDLCEAPEILCRDPGFDDVNNGMAATPGDSEGLFALVGVRATHLVSRNQVYFTGPGCTGDAYLAPPAVPDPPAAPGLFPPELPVGYFNCSLQVDASGTRVCYGVGPPSDWGVACAALPCADGGTLYRSVGSTLVTPAITSRWVSLNPDCADTPGDDGGSGAGSELVTNGSFELPPLPDDDFSNAASGPPPPLPIGWSVSGTAGHWNPPVTRFTPDPAFGGSNVPDGDQTSYVFTAVGGPEFTQPIATLPAGGTCSLSTWIGRRMPIVMFFPPGAFASYEVRLVDSGATTIASISGTIDATSPEWELFSTAFAAAGTAPYTLELDAGASGGSAPVSFEDVSLVCTSMAGGGASDEICDDDFDMAGLSLLPAVAVTEMDGTNVLAPFTPLFNSMAPAVSEVMISPPAHEGAPLATPTGPITETGQPDFEPPGDENDPPP